MANKKISELTALTGAALVDADLIPVVDTSATTTKKISLEELKIGLDTASGFIRKTGGAMTGDLTFGDSDKAIFGAGSVLEIYGDATTSYIKESGTGDLKVRANRFVVQDVAGTKDFLIVSPTAGAVFSHLVGATMVDRITTTFGGVALTGTVTADGLTVSGNVGIGVVPSTIWSSSYYALQIGLGGSMYAHAAAGSNMHMAANSVYEGTAPNYYDKYLTSSTASKYVQDSGLHIWSTAASGTAGDAITWSEAMRIDASGNLLVGKTATGIGTTGSEILAGGQLLVTADGDNSADFNRKTSDGVIALFRKDSTTVGSIGTTGGDLIIGTGDTGLYFYDAATSVIPWKISTNATSNGYSDLGHPSYQWKDLYLSGGVVFGATGGDVSSKTLDDYEEGTWTPSLGGDATYTTQIGNYTKIGNLVTIRGSVVIDVLGTGSTTVMSGLPFAENNANNFTGSVCSYFADIATSLSVLIASADINASSVKFTGQGAAGTTMLVPAVFASGSRVDFAFSYEV